MKRILNKTIKTTSFLIIGLGFLITNPSNVNAYDIIDQQFQVSINQIDNNYKEEMKIIEQNETNSEQVKMNLFIKKMQNQLRPKFVNKKSKELDIYVRENVKVIDKRYVKKTSAGWERIKILDTNLYN